MNLDWIEKYLYGQTAYGLEIILKSDNAIRYRLIKSTILKNKLEIEEKQEGDSFKALFEYNWSKKLPLFLSLSGKGIIQKKVYTKVNENVGDLIQKVLPNAKISDFYFQSQQINQDESWIALIRKNILDQILKELRKQEIHIVGIELGLLTLGKLSGVLEVERIKIHENNIDLKNGLVETETGISSNYADKVKLGEEWVETFWLPSFAASLCFYGIEEEKNDNFYIDEDKKEFKQHAIFLFGLKFSLAFFSIVLLLNFFFFQNYNAQYSESISKLELNSSFVYELENLQKDYNKNQLFFKNTGLISSSKNSFYADKLASSVPKGIYWNQLEMNPSLKKIKENEDVSFQIGLINISGNTSNSKLLSQWIQVLEKEEWIEAIDIKDYKKLEDSKGGSFFLQIKVQ